jgi:hypothetical protein
MYVTGTPADPVADWAERGGIVDAIARGDDARAHILAAQHTQRTTTSHRLRPVGADMGVRNPQQAVNIAGPQN